MRFHLSSLLVSAVIGMVYAQSSDTLVRRDGLGYGKPYKGCAKPASHSQPTNSALPKLGSAAELTPLYVDDEVAAPYHPKVPQVTVYTQPTLNAPDVAIALQTVAPGGGYVPKPMPKPTGRPLPGFKAPAAAPVYAAAGPGPTAAALPKANWPQTKAVDDVYSGRGAPYAGSADSYAPQHVAIKVPTTPTTAKAPKTPTAIKAPKTVVRSKAPSTYGGAESGGNAPPTIVKAPKTAVRPKDTYAGAAPAPVSAKAPKTVLRPKDAYTGGAPPTSAKAPKTATGPKDTYGPDLPVTSGSLPKTSTVDVPGYEGLGNHGGSECGNGDIHCCDQAISNDSAGVGLFGNLLGGLTAGVNCVPITAAVLGVVGKSACKKKTLCCSGDTIQQGLINFGCTNLGLDVL
ncbi:hypothetical protein CXG81DRAFT_27824 [Caulochytrium protostelioides]|uniref:Hydrophobin n=1 Tax=Caulochytrium protostelioides TaxID=1555241 RepID=A0A4P9X318_9FUNG|nr:hypothetical protein CAUPRSCDRAFT_11170 [Caulochytrium protostelioides]RKO99405.1 hypothetical protein CXG81DRAFT_27824 [Caulochytrium protostelioides]|eukprot:RKO99405.1 hypothetical protein CXG81DRAFT_27824 [Caulochytrium protostelioides]